MRLLSILLLMLVSALPAFAQATTVKPDQSIPQHQALTYADLIRLAAPDFAATGSEYHGTLALPLRNIAYPEDPDRLDVAIRLSSLEAVLSTSDNRDSMALLVDTEIEEGAFSSVLIVVDITEDPRLVDLADVASDQSTSFNEQALLDLSDGDQALLISSSHFNSSQGYRSTSVVAVMGDRLTSLASAFTLRENYCGVDRQQMAAFAALESSADYWQPFTITVTEATLHSAEDCGGLAAEPATRSVAATFSWNAAAGRYEPDSNALADLYHETEQRF